MEHDAGDIHQKSRRIIERIQGVFVRYLFRDLLEMAKRSLMQLRIGAMLPEETTIELEANPVAQCRYFAFVLAERFLKRNVIRPVQVDQRQRYITCWNGRELAL